MAALPLVDSLDYALLYCPTCGRQRLRSDFHSSNPVPSNALFRRWPSRVDHVRFVVSTRGWTSHNQDDQRDHQAQESQETRRGGNPSRDTPYVPFSFFVPCSSAGFGILVQVGHGPDDPSVVLGVLFQSMYIETKVEFSMGRI